MSDFDEISAIFASIREEAQKYMPEQQVSVITGCYGLLTAFMPPENPFVKLSLENALYLTKLGLQSEYVASAILIYPYLEKEVNNIKLPIQFGDLVLLIMQRLLLLATNFESYLPWIKESPLKVRDASTKVVRPKKNYWEEKKIEQSMFAFLATAQNPETATVKIVERFYLLKNIIEFPITEDLHKRLAQDTLDIFSPVAEALGMWSIKSQSEDLAFKILQPDLYKAIALDLQERLQERQARIDRLRALITDFLRQDNVIASVSGRPKHIYGLYKKVIQTKKSIADINDSLAVRIIVNDIADCYVALSALEKHFGLAEGVYEKGKKYRDWIKTPKPNQYQSIHTTILFEGKMVEVQIRTQAMHDLAEYGAAAHWLYRKAGNTKDQQEKYKNYVEIISDIRLRYEKNLSRKK